LDGARLGIGRIVPVLPSEFRLIDDHGLELGHSLTAWATRGIGSRAFADLKLTH